MATATEDRKWHVERHCLNKSTTMISATSFSMDAIYIAKNWNADYTTDNILSLNNIQIFRNICLESTIIKEKNKVHMVFKPQPVRVPDLI
jgi:uncharacterized protein YydD (DUF2326 family)